MNANETIYAAAQTWVSEGYGVIPLQYKDKRPAGDALMQVGSCGTNSDGRRHGSWTPYRKRLPTDEELRLWFCGPKRNLGLIMGWRELVVVDFDTLVAYGTWLQWAIQTGGMAAAVAMHTYRVMSARGVHLYLRCQEPVEPFRVGVIDVKAAGGYVLAPPSVHPSGSAYRAADPTAQIVPIERLDDVFPLQPPRRECDIEAEIVCNDPWEAAERATVLEPGMVSRILARVRIEDVLGIAPTGGRKEVRICCPLHHDTHPSMLVNLSTQKCVCFAGCNRGRRMDVLDVYAQMHGLSNREAIQQLGAKVLGCTG